MASIESTSWEVSAVGSEDNAEIGVEGEVEGGDGADANCGKVDRAQAPVDRRVAVGNAEP
jgi:hypothetical protein